MTIVKTQVENARSRIFCRRKKSHVMFWVTNATSIQAIDIDVYLCIYYYFFLSFFCARHITTYRVGFSATRSSNGSSQSSLHSQWLSKNVRTSAMAASAPRTLDRTKPSRFSFRITRTLFIFANSKPSSAKNVHAYVNARTDERIRREQKKKWVNEKLMNELDE